MRKSNFIFNVLLLPLDYFMLLVAGIANYFLRTKIIAFFRPATFSFDLPFEKYFFIILIVAVFFVIAYAISGLYNMRATRRLGEEFLKIIVASSAGVMGIIIYIFLRQELFNSRFLVLGGWFMAILFVALGRILIRQIQALMISRLGFGVRKVMVIGDDIVTDKVKEYLEQAASSGYRLVKHLINPEVSEVKLAIGNPGIDEVLLANPNYPAEKVLELIEFCHDNHINFKFVPNLFQTLTTNALFDTFAGVPVVELRRTALDGWGQVAKRIIDLLGSAIGLILLSPIFAIIAFAIKWEPMAQYL